MKPLHISLNTALSACKPNTFISTFTHSYQVFLPRPAHPLTYCSRNIPISFQNISHISTPVLTDHTFAHLTFTCTSHSHAPHIHMHLTFTCTSHSHAPHINMHLTLTCTTHSHAPHIHLTFIHEMLFIKPCSDHCYGLCQCLKKLLENLSLYYIK